MFFVQLNYTKVQEAVLFLSTASPYCVRLSKHFELGSLSKRLDEGDVSLVNDIKEVMISSKVKHFYSFASKYCSHHRPTFYPIYDSYVDQVLRYFRNRDKFYKFKNGDLKEYSAFKRVLAEFQKFYSMRFILS